ncbi:hypothetical protein [Streptomyces sp. NPDC003247]|uniref:hypothetical protein n=1 Tax=Streptomyces sp. NPDC003247 TaxID=3364677 RepID=UPI00368CD5AC
MAMTLLVLGVVLLGPLAGSGMDHFGRTRPLFGAMSACTVVGAAPFPAARCSKSSKRLP